MTASAKNRSIRLPCVFVNDVKCPYRKSMKQYVLRQCEVCSHAERFEREMEEEDERIMNEIDEMRRTWENERIMNEIDEIRRTGVWR